MEAVSVLQQLVKALLTLKGLYDQDRVNKNEIDYLQECIDGYQKEIKVGFKNRGADDSRFKKLERVVIEATTDLEKWATDKRFFRLFRADERMKQLERLTNKVERAVREFQFSDIMAGIKRIEEQKARAASPQPIKADQSRYCSKPKRIKYHALCADHKVQLVAADEKDISVLYVVSKDTSAERTVVCAYVDDYKFESCSYTSEHRFLSTCPPFTSGSGKLYLGGKMLRDGGPIVLVWQPKIKFFHPLRSPRSAARSDWEYTVIAQSSTGSVLYCGCSDGRIEKWERDSSNVLFYKQSLTGHRGGISGLSVSKNGVLLSVDQKDRNIVRVWRSSELVAFLDLKDENVRRMACTYDGNLYIATERANKLWCHNQALKNIVDRRATPDKPPTYVGQFSPLQHPNSSANNIARSCLVANASSDMVYFLCALANNQSTYHIERWHENKCVSRVDTELPELNSWTVSRIGTLYCCSRRTGEIWVWKPNPEEHKFRRSKST